ncbi:unnamed protein product [Bathycoccus prasinos]
MSSSGTRKREEMLDADGNAIVDGVLTPTPDSPADSEWRSRAGPLDVNNGNGGPWKQEDCSGPQPADMYGKFTWKIENFSEISKRELRSKCFEVGGYKWYILVYPQGCDVHNHLSLFLCVADYDKLLPGWSHFAQFTIAVVNKDPKKSKYSDTLHRFCKKEHDWGWKKFMELGKVLDGFTVADTLVIKAQVQVIHEKIARPFRCLDPQYRRELVRVYLTNVEGICRRFLEEKREKLYALRKDPEKWENLRNFWNNRTLAEKTHLASEKADDLLKGIVKRFFNEKEVTSTLVMDALYCGCRALDAGSTSVADAVKASANSSYGSAALSIATNTCVLTGDLVCALERAADGTAFDVDDIDLDDSSEGRSSKRSKLGEDSSKDDSKKDNDSKDATKKKAGFCAADAVERDEHRLAELGRKTIEMYVLSRVFNERVEVAFREAEALMRQEALIAEEEEAERLAAEENEKKHSKKQKQKERQRLKKLAEDEERARLEKEEAEKKAAIEAEKEAEREKQRAIKRAQDEELRKKQEEEQRIKDEKEREAREKREAIQRQKDEEKAKKKAEKEKAEAEKRKAREEVEAKERKENKDTTNKSDSPASKAGNGADKSIPTPNSAGGSPGGSSSEPPLVRELRGRISALESALTEKAAEVVRLRRDLRQYQQGSPPASSGKGSDSKAASIPRVGSGSISGEKPTAAAVAAGAPAVSAATVAGSGGPGAPPLPPGPPPPPGTPAIAVAAGGSASEGDRSVPMPPSGPPPPPRGPPPPTSLVKGVAQMSVSENGAAPAPPAPGSFAHAANAGGAAPPAGANGARPAAWMQQQQGQPPVPPVPGQQEDNFPHFGMIENLLGDLGDDFD